MNLYIFFIHKNVCEGERICVKVVKKFNEKDSWELEVVCWNNLKSGANPMRID